MEQWNNQIQTGLVKDSKTSSKGTKRHLPNPFFPPAEVLYNYI